MITTMKRVGLAAPMAAVSRADAVAAPALLDRDTINKPSCTFMALRSYVESATNAVDHLGDAECCPDADVRLCNFADRWLHADDAVVSVDATEAAGAADDSDAAPTTFLPKFTRHHCDTPG